VNVFLTGSSITFATTYKTNPELVANLKIGRNDSLGSIGLRTNYYRLPQPPIRFFSALAMFGGSG